jgi:hypothetical protein
MRHFVSIVAGAIAASCITVSARGDDPGEKVRFLFSSVPFPRRIGWAP